MATRARTTAYPAEAQAHEHDEHERWRDRTQIFLQPVAAPSILGLFGFAGATMMVGAWQAGWYGDANTGLLLFPFALTFGGLAQFLAGMWSYKARDGLATAMHGMWGSFWLAFGLLFGLNAGGVIPTHMMPAFGSTNAPWAFWFVVLCVITLFGAIAALGESLALVAVLAPLAAASGLTAVGFFTGGLTITQIGGWVFVGSALAAVYTAGAMMLAESFGRTILPLGKYAVDANIPGRQPYRPMEYEAGQPGVRAGQ